MGEIRMGQHRSPTAIDWLQSHINANLEQKAYEIPRS